MNPVRLLADFVASLPPELAPETTEGYEGFIHPHEAQADPEQARCVLILRDHDWEKLQGHKALLERLAEEAAARRPGAQVEIAWKVQYRNMKEFIDRDPRVLDAAVEAYRREGYEATFPAIRGGTDGSRLSERACPRRTSSRAGTTTTRAASGSACTTWAPRPPSSCTSPGVGGAGGELVAQSH